MWTDQGVHFRVIMVLGQNGVLSEQIEQLELEYPEQDIISLVKELK